jgi:hypothetical protein
MKLLAQRRICEIVVHSLANERCNFAFQSIAKIDINASARVRLLLLCHFL